MYIINSAGIAYHQHEVLYIIKPQVDARWRVMIYKGGLPPLMICTALRAVMIYQACGDMMHLLRKYDVAPLRSAMMRCLPQCAVRHTSLGEAVIIGAANIICRRQTSFKKRTFVGRQKCVFCWWRQKGSNLRPYGCEPYALTN